MGRARSAANHLHFIAAYIPVHRRREFGDRFVRLGDVATIEFGIKSGYDTFFMPRDAAT
jgi:hypothetical protein